MLLRTGLLVALCFAGPSTLAADIQYGDDIGSLVKFGLYTKKNPNSYTELSVGDAIGLVNSNFDFTHDTKIVIHGFLDNITSLSIQTIKNAFMDNYDFNVIGVDWGLISKDLIYTVAADQTERVGKYVAQFIDFLVSVGVRLEDIHLIGHSLGAHVSGFAGQYTSSGKPSRITGLDPALPAFYEAGPDERLDPTDAKFVDCIHTCGEIFGFLKPICSVDFYPNGGVPIQPGCTLLNAITCSHLRSFYYFAESIYPDHIFSTSLCSEIPSFTGSGCNASSLIMGYPTPTSASGIYYTKTHSDYPFAPNQPSNVTIHG